MAEMEDMPVGSAPAAPARSGIGYVFIGREGLRAGWSLLLFVIFTVAIALTIHYLMPRPDRHAGAGMAPRGVMIGEAVSFLTMAAAAFLVSLIERRPFTGYGLKRTLLVPDFLKGAAWGLIMLSLLVGVLALSGALVFDNMAQHGAQALAYAGEWLLGFLLVGLFEEFLFRGFLQYTLARGVTGIVHALSPGNPRARTIGFWVAAAVFSVVLFAVAHMSNGGETPFGLIAVSLAGLTFVYVLYRTGSLWWAIGFHMTWDWAQSFLYGVPDSGGLSEGRLFQTHAVGAQLLSGGTTGPEGSLLVIPTLLLTMFVIHKTLPKRATAFDAIGPADPSGGNLRPVFE